MGNREANPCASFDFPVQSFEHVGGSQPTAHGIGQHEHGKSFGDVFLQPGRQSRRFGFYSKLQQSAGFITVGSVEDVSAIPHHAVKPAAFKER